MHLDPHRTFAFAQQNKFEEILVKGSKDFLFLASTQTFKMLRKGI